MDTGSHGLSDARGPAHLDGKGPCAPRGRPGTAIRYCRGDVRGAEIQDEAGGVYRPESKVRDSLEKGMKSLDQTAGLLLFRVLFDNGLASRLTNVTP